MLPLIADAPKLEEDTEVAPLELQVNVVFPLYGTDVGLALRDIVGGLGPTVKVALPDP